MEPISEIGESSTSKPRSFAMATDRSLVFKEIRADFSATTPYYGEFLMNRFHERSHKRQMFALSTLEGFIKTIIDEGTASMFDDKETDKAAYWQKWKESMDEKVAAQVQDNQTAVAGEEDQLHFEGNQTADAADTMQLSHANDFLEDYINAHLIGGVIVIHILCPCGKCYEFLNKESKFFVGLNQMDAAVFWASQSPSRMGMDCFCGKAFLVNKVGEKTISFCMV